LADASSRRLSWWAFLTAISGCVIPYSKFRD
jgi:hypothetical protein